MMLDRTYCTNRECTKKYCDGCEYLTPKEKDQTEKKEPHFCKRLRMNLRHENEHPRIPTPTICHLGKPCEDKLTLEVEASARLHGKMLSLHAELCKDHVETKG